MGEASGSFSESSVDGKASLQSVQRVKSVVQAFLFLNVISLRVKKLVCPTDNGFFRDFNQGWDLIFVAFQQRCDI